MSALILPEEKLLVSPGSVAGIYYSPLSSTKDNPNLMKSVKWIEAIVDRGLRYEGEWDRYADKKGSFSDKKSERFNRQVSFMNARFFEGTQFTHEDSWRNVITKGTELLWLLPTSTEPGKAFRIGTAWFQAEKYLDPCKGPSARTGKPGFKETFVDCGAIIARVIRSGGFRVDDPIFHEKKKYGD